MYIVVTLENLCIFGHNQKLQNVAKLRSKNINYINDTLLPIIVMITESANGNSYIYVDAQLIMKTITADNDVTLTFIVPPNSSYKMTGSSNFSCWIEYR